jgi:hypothetical protein
MSQKLGEVSRIARRGFLTCARREAFNQCHERCRIVPTDQSLSSSVRACGVKRLVRDDACCALLDSALKQEQFNEVRRGPALQFTQPFGLTPVMGGTPATRIRVLVQRLQFDECTSGRPGTHQRDVGPADACIDELRNDRQPGATGYVRE